MYESPKVIIEVGKYLQQPLPLAQEDLRQHLIGLESMRYQLAEAIADQIKLVYDKRKQMLWPKDADKGLTELDRNTRLNADVSVMERDKEFLLRIEEMVLFRLNMGMLLID